MIRIPDQWTWMSGANTTNQVGTYGTKGCTGCCQRARRAYGGISWTDSTGNFWLFGGGGYGSTGIRAI